MLNQINLRDTSVLTKQFNQNVKCDKTDSFFSGVNNRLVKTVFMCWPLSLTYAIWQHFCTMNELKMFNCGIGFIMMIANKVIGFM